MNLLNLPPDTIRYTLMQLPYDEVKKLCGMPEFKVYCTKYFWRDLFHRDLSAYDLPYLRENYLDAMNTLSSYDTVRQKLFYACGNGFEIEVQKAIKQGVSDSDKNLAFGYAVVNGYLNIVKYLVDNGADIHVYNNGMFGEAVANGHLNIVNYLSENGVNYDYIRALIIAATIGYSDIVMYLVERGANVKGDDNLTLVTAAQTGHLEIVKYLIDHGADIHAREDIALRNAAFYGYLDVVKYLVENGANIHAENDLALQRAAIKGHLDVVKYLISKGIKRRSLITALDYARQSNQEHVVDYIRPYITK